MVAVLTPSLPANRRSHSFQPRPSSSHQVDAGSSFESDSTIALTTSMTATTSSSTLLHPSTNQSSDINASQTAARSRTRSVGADANITSSFNRNEDLLGELPRGPGTPDFTLSDYENRKAGNKKSTNSIGNEIYTTRKRPSSDASRPTAPARPRLTTQLRSFFTSFRGASAGLVANEEEEKEKATSTKLQSVEKARSSYGDERESNSWQSQTSTAIKQRLQPLMMPAARPAGPDGLHGLNADSPPLTPASEEETKESYSVDYLQGTSLVSMLRHPWAAAQALADGTSSSPLYSGVERDCTTPASSSMTVSSSASERASPAFSNFSATSSTSTFVPSRPSSSIAMLKLSTTPTSLLPSHSSSPTNSSPCPPHHATKAYWHAKQTTPLSVLFSRWSWQFSSTRMPPLRPHLPALLFLMTAFIGSTMCILLALSTLPLHLPSHITDLTISEIRDMSVHLKTYSQSSPKAFAHTLAVLAAFFTWKQSFTIPGSLIMNVVFGAMYGTWMGTLYTSTLTSIGGVFCYLLLAPLGPLIRTLPGLHTVLEKMQQAMRQNSNQSIRSPRSASNKRLAEKNLAKEGNGSIWSYLLVLRVLPIVPYGLMNIACSVLRIPLLPYALTLAVGSIPWNACTVQVGDILVQVVSALDDSKLSSSSLDLDGGFHNVSPGTMLGQEVVIQSKAESGAMAIAAKVWNKEMMFKLVLMSLVSLAPLLLQRYLKRRNEELSNIGDDTNDGEILEATLSDLDQEAAFARKEEQRFLSGNNFASSLNVQQQPDEFLPSKRFSDVWTKAVSDIS